MTYIWGVRVHKTWRYKTFRSKRAALSYYYSHKYDCSYPEKLY